MNKKRIAVVLGTGIGPSGGVRTMARFLYHTVQNSGSYQPTLISVAASSKDEASVCLRSPKNWHKGIQVLEGCWQGIPFYHVGAFMAEFEFQRVRPRRVLTQLLSNYDLIQVVAGTPAIAYAITHVNEPKCIFVATTIAQERTSMLSRTHGLKKLWLHMMTHINSQIEAYALPHMGHVFAESEYTRNLVSRLIPADRVSLGVPGVDTSLFHPEENYCPDGYILSVGRFTDPRKNVRLLLDAYRQLCSTLSNPPRLVLAGRGGLTQRDWALSAEWDIGDYIDTYQDVSAEELANLYRHASMFVLPSDEEGLGIVLLEAMASGIPVVSTKCGGPETAVIDGETGYLIPIGDSYALANRMLELMDNPPLRWRMGEAGRRLAQERFSLSVAGQAYLEVYDQLLG
jgi:D-inositol-3-phosphate glycosyltransferase